jgi:two-component system, LytTR family, response regulator
MNPIKLLLVDDHPDSLEILEYFVSDLPFFQLVGTCTNGDQLVEKVMVNKPDLVLSDINMPFMNGVDAIKECLAFYPSLKFIFITGYDEFAVEAFRLTAVDYIVKPYEKERLYKALQKAHKLIFLEQSRTGSEFTDVQIKKLPLKNQNCIQYIPFNDINFIEKVGKKCLVYTEREIIESNDSLGKILERLDHNFFPSHRAYIINLNKVTHIKPHGETFVADFENYKKQAYISKLKINEVREKMATLIEQ